MGEAERGRKGGGGEGGGCHDGGVHARVGRVEVLLRGFRERENEREDLAERALFLAVRSFPDDADALAALADWLSEHYLRVTNLCCC